MTETQFDAQREQMVTSALSGRGITDPRVLKAMAHVPRHVFVPEILEQFAYVDGPLSIGSGQTISQPSMVAVMAQALKLKSTDRILEVGTGSGYGAAVLSMLGAHVHTVERHQRLALTAQHNLAKLGFEQVDAHWADGTQGWGCDAPYDAIAITAASPKIPEALLRQLVVGGRLVMPIGDSFSQTLTRLTRTASGFRRKMLMKVRCVPLILGVSQTAEQREVASMAA